MICLEATPPGYAVLWSVGVGAAIVPVVLRCGSRADDAINQGAEFRTGRVYPP